MNAVVYYSNTGESKRISEFVAKNTGYPCFDIFELSFSKFDTLALVFPVYCQNIPAAVWRFLNSVSAKRLVLVATYGKMSYGNVLWEIQNKTSHNVIAAAYVPTKHSYLENDSRFENFEALKPILNKIASDCNECVKIKKSFKNPFASFFKDWRSRIGVKIYKDKKCDNCGVCAEVCKSSAIKNGKTDRRCIRCLKCVNECPRAALHFKLSPLMRTYLSKNKKNELKIFV